MKKQLVILILGVSIITSCQSIKDTSYTDDVYLTRQELMAQRTQSILDKQKRNEEMAEKRQQSRAQQPQDDYFDQNYAGSSRFSNPNYGYGGGFGGGGFYPSMHMQYSMFNNPYHRGMGMGYGIGMSYGNCWNCPNYGGMYGMYDPWMQGGMYGGWGSPYNNFHNPYYNPWGYGYHNPYNVGYLSGFHSGYNAGGGDINRPPKIYGARGAGISSPGMINAPSGRTGIGSGTTPTRKSAPANNSATPNQTMQPNQPGQQASPNSRSGRNNPNQHFNNRNNPSTPNTAPSRERSAPGRNYEAPSSPSNRGGGGSFSSPPSRGSSPGGGSSRPSSPNSGFRR